MPISVARWRTGAFAALLLAVAPLADAAPSGVSAIGGAITTVAVSNGRVYAGSAARLLVFSPDPGNSSGYAQTGATAPLSDLIRGVAVVNGRAYVAAASAGLSIFDVSRQGDPIALGVVAPPGYAEDVAVAGNLALLADGPLGLRVIDVSTPQQPAEVGWAFEGKQAMGVAAREQYAFVAAGGAGLLIADIAAPARPLELAALPLPGLAKGVVLSGDYAFVLLSWGGVGIVNIADPAKPVLAGTYATPGWAVRAAISGKTMALADAYRGVRMLDISDPLHPVETGASESDLCDVAAVAIDGASVWTADRYYGLSVLSTSSGLASTGVYQPFAAAWSVAISGKYAYVSAREHGLRVVDISDPDHMREVAVYPVGNAAAATINGSYLYLSVFFGDSTMGFHVVDISNPLQPSRAAFLPNSVLPMNVPRDHFTVGAFSYVTNEMGTFIVDATDPANPQVTGFVPCPTGGPTLGVVVRDNLAYVAQEGVGLLILDVSDPRSPKQLAVAPLSNSPQDVALSGNYALVSGMFGTLSVVDISDPQHPRSFDTQLPSGRGIWVNGSRAYLGTLGAGIQELDISQPIAPRVTGFFHTAGYARKAIVDRDRLWIADAETGLWSVPLNALTSPSSATAVGASPSAPQIRMARPIRNRGDVPSLPPISRALRPARPALVHADAAGCVVSKVADSGEGSLRDCLAGIGAGGSITFEASVFRADRQAVIRLLSPLPPITVDQVTIDASGANVLLDGTRLGPNDNAIVILSNGNTIQGLRFDWIPGAAILVTGGASGNRIGGDRAQGRGNTVTNGASGIVLSGAGTTGNVVVGNYLGTPDGEHASGWIGKANQTRPCIAISGGATANQIGGTAPEDRNLIVNCGWPAGLLITGKGTTDNVVIGNYISLNAEGDKFTMCGETRCQFGTQIYIGEGASRNRIGGDAPGERNIISGSPNAAVGVNDLGTVDNVIVGNYFGTDATGNAVLRNQLMAIWLDGASSRTRIERNLISSGGVAISGDYNVLLGNLIGVDRTGMKLADGSSVHTANMRARRNRFGGAESGEGNTVASPGGAFQITAPGTEENFVIGNRIGTDVTGSALPQGANTSNPGAAFQVSDGAKRNVIGGSTDAEGNLIAGSGGDGLFIGNAGVSGSFVGHNWIGANRDGVTAIANRGHGVFIFGADHTFVMGNHIAGNGRDGVFLNAPAATIRANSISGNQDGIGAGASRAWIRSVTATTVSGSACAGCVVEIFSDNGNQGAFYEGVVRASATGTFVLTKPGGFQGPNLTATATGPDGATSSFSAPVLAIPR